MNKPTTVLIVDDHAFFRTVLSRPLEDSPHTNVVAAVGNGYEALDACHAHNPDVVLMDLNMTMMDGLTATAEIKRQYPQSKILILTGMEDHTQAIAAFEAGAAGYMRKDSITPSNLVTAIQCVANGGVYIDPSVFTVLLPSWYERKPQSSISPLIVNLTAGEINLLRQVALGRDNQKIAEMEEVSKKTVANKISMLFTEIGANGRVQATHFALRHAIIHLDETAV